MYKNLVRINPTTCRFSGIFKSFFEDFVVNEVFGSSKMVNLGKFDFCEIESTLLHELAKYLIIPSLSESDNDYRLKKRRVTVAQENVADYEPANINLSTCPTILEPHVGLLTRFYEYLYTLFSNEGILLAKEALRNMSCSSWHDVHMLVNNSLLNKIRQVQVSFLFDTSLEKDERRQFHQFINEQMKFFEATNRILCDNDIITVILTYDISEDSFNKETAQGTAGSVVFTLKLRDEFIYHLLGVSAKDLLMMKNLHVYKYKLGDINNCYISLLKKNLEHNDAISMISKVTGIATKYINFAGTKDKRAVTSQLACISNCTKEKLLAASLQLQKSSLANVIQINYYKHDEQVLKLGDLTGNHFSVVLRNLKNFNNHIDLLNSLKLNGFINYFGPQRFGSFCIKTHFIGILLLSDKLRLAFNAILYNENCKNKTYKAIDIADKVMIDNFELVKPNIKKIEELLNNEACSDYEGKLSRTYMPAFKYLKKQPNDLLNALNLLPKKLLTKYIHAVQSMIWNLTVSYRLSICDNRSVIVGDMVLVNNNELKTINTNEEAMEYNITDVVIPLIGTEVTIPQSVVDILHKICLTLTGMAYSDIVKGPFAHYLVGSYRKITEVPQFVDYYFAEDTNSPVFDFTQLIKMSDLVVDVKNRPNIIKKDIELLDIPSNMKKNCLILFCMLNKGSYFTSLLAELLDDQSLVEIENPIKKFLHSAKVKE